MKSLVVYYSKTWNTKKVADAIAKVLDVDARGVRGLKGFSPDGLLVVGSGTYSNKSGKGMTEFLQKLPSMKGKKAAVFETASRGGGAGREMEGILKEKGATVVGSFSCRGSLLKFINRGRPNEEDMENARKFAAGLRKLSKSNSD